MSKKFGVIIGFGPLVSLEVAKKFVANNYELLVISRSLDKVTDLATEVGEAVQPMEGDANHYEHLISQIRKVVDDRGRLDLLHYHVGFGLNKLPLELEDGDLDQVNTLSTKAPLAQVKEFLTDLERTTGSFLVTGGGFALHPSAEFSAYSIGNAARRNLVFTLYQQLRERIHVATVTISMTVDNRDSAKNIADKFYELSVEPQQSWRPEIIYSEN